jgi:hypothetical protein
VARWFFTPRYQWRASPAPTISTRTISTSQRSASSTRPTYRDVKRAENWLPARAIERRPLARARVGRRFRSKDPGRRSPPDAHNPRQPW